MFEAAPTTRISTTTVLEQESASVAELMQAAATVVAFDVDAENGKVVNWNVDCERLFQFSPHETLGHNFAALFSWDERIAGRVERCMEEARHKGWSSSELWAVCRDGSHFLCRLLIESCQDTAVMQVRCTDVTQLLLVAEKFLVCHSLPQISGLNTDRAIVMLGRAGTVIHWDSDAERIFGYSCSEVLGRRLTSFYSRESQIVSRDDQNLALAVRSGSSTAVRFCRSKLGEQVVVHLLTKPLRNDRNELAGFYIIVTDLRSFEVTQAPKRGS